MKKSLVLFIFFVFLFNPFLVFSADLEKFDWLQKPTQDVFNKTLPQIFQDVWGGDYYEKVNSLIVTEDKIIDSIFQVEAGEVYGNKEIIIQDRKDFYFSEIKPMSIMWVFAFHGLGHANRAHIENHSLIELLNKNLSKQELYKAAGHYFVERMFSELYAIFSSVYAGYKLDKKYDNFPIELYYYHFGYSRSSACLASGDCGGFYENPLSPSLIYFCAESFMYLVVDNFDGDLDMVNHYLMNTSNSKLAKDLLKICRHGERNKDVAGFIDVKNAMIKYFNNYQVDKTPGLPFSSAEMEKLNKAMHQGLIYCDGIIKKTP